MLGFSRSNPAGFISGMMFIVSSMVPASAESPSIYVTELSSGAYTIEHYFDGTESLPEGATTVSAVVEGVGDADSTSVKLFYTIDGSLPGTESDSIDLSFVGPAEWQGILPAQTEGSEVNFFIQAQEGTGTPGRSALLTFEVRLPQGKPWPIIANLNTQYIGSPYEHQLDIGGGLSLVHHPSWPLENWDNLMRTYRQAGAVPILVLFADMWQDEGVPQEEVDSKCAEFAAALEVLLDRYDGLTPDPQCPGEVFPRVAAWDIGNEVNVAPDQVNFYIRPDHYLQLLWTVHPLIRAKNGMTTISLSGGGTSTYTEYLDDLYEVSVTTGSGDLIDGHDYGNHFDAIDIHIYGPSYAKHEGYPAEAVYYRSFETVKDALMDTLIGHGFGPKPVCCQEQGSYSGMPLLTIQGPLMPYQLESEQAGDYVRRLVLSAAEGYWYTVVCPLDTASWEPTYFGYLGAGYNGRFERDKGYAVKKTFFFTFQRLTRYLRDAEFVEEIDLPGEDAFAYRFIKAGRYLSVAWLDDDDNSVSIDTTGWGEIGLDLITGHIQTNAGQWDLTSAPIMFFDPLHAPSQEFGTLQSAIDAAKALGGWMVCVPPGNYSESLAMKNRVDLYGPGDWHGSQCATLTASVTFEDVNTGSLCGFVLSPVSGLAVACFRSHPTLFENLYTGAALGISLQDSDAKISHSRFQNCSVGLTCRGSDPLVSNNIFHGGGLGILIEDVASRAMIINNTFYDLTGQGESIPAETCPADFDDDDDVDQEDFGHLQACFSGNSVYCETGCEGADFNSDDHVDQDDFVVFLSCMGGSKKDPTCKLGGKAIRFLNGCGMLSEASPTAMRITNNIFSQCSWFALTGDGTQGQPFIRYNLFWPTSARAYGCSAGETPAILHSVPGPFSGLNGSRLALYVNDLQSQSPINVDITSDLTDAADVADYLNTRFPSSVMAQVGPDSRILILTSGDGPATSLRVQDRRYAFGGPRDANLVLGFAYTTALGSGGNVAGDPVFIDAQQGDFQLATGSAAKDAGDPEIIYQDPNGSRNDIGAYGGNEARTPPTVP